MLILVERSVATIKAATYENVYYKAKFIRLHIYLFCASMLLSTVYTLGIIEPPLGLPLAIVWSLSAFFLTTFVIKLNIRKTERLYQGGYTLSKRFTLLENVTAMRLAAFMISYTIVCFIIWVLLFILNRVEIGWWWQNVAGMTLNVHVSIYACTICIIGYRADAHMYTLAKAIIVKKWRSIWSNKPKNSAEVSEISITMRPRGVHGKALYTEAKQDDYFGQLHTQWSIKPEPEKKKRISIR
ncbi:unnamed protein product, partial [Mesorhabditis spiculigera]